MKEDKTLRELKEVRKIGKWSQIAAIMKEEFQIYGRNGKQCRERYHNHLDSRISKREWDFEEENKLLALHDLWGNRWAAISRELPGRTDNCVKNHFYSCFRRGIKNVNYLINSSFKKRVRPLKLSIINKIVNVIEAYHKQPENFDTKVYEEAKEIKSFITKMKDDGCGNNFNEQNLENTESIENLNSKLSQFNQNCRKKKMGVKKRNRIESDDSEDMKSSFTPQNDILEHKIHFNSEENKHEDNPSDHKIKIEHSKDEKPFKHDAGEIPTFPSISQTPLKNASKDERYKNSSYSHLNSIDYMEVKSYGNLPMRELIFLDEEKEWKLYFD